MERFMLNTITLPNATQLKIPKKQLPFANSFKPLRPAKQYVTMDGVVTDYFHTFVELSGDMGGRVLSVFYTVDGVLVGAHTVN
jgi:hypothetical protein